MNESRILLSCKSGQSVWNQLAVISGWHSDSAHCAARPLHEDSATFMWPFVQTGNSLAGGVRHGTDSSVLHGDQRSGQDGTKLVTLSRNCDCDVWFMKNMYCCWWYCGTRDKSLKVPEWMNKWKFIYSAYKTFIQNLACHSTRYTQCIHAGSHKLKTIKGHSYQ